MTDEIKLGTLEFKPEILSIIGLMDLKEPLQIIQKVLADEINRILRAKLSKCTQVWGYEDLDFGTWVYFTDEDAPSSPTHTARLIVVEEIKK